MLSHVRNDYRDVVGLLRCSGPLFGRRDQVFSQTLRCKIRLPKYFSPYSLPPKFLAVHVFRLRQSVAEQHEQAAGLHSYHSLSKWELLEETYDRAPLFKFLHFAFVNEKRRQMSRVCVRQRARLLVIHRIEESRVAVVRRIPEEVPVQLRH